MGSGSTPALPGPPGSCTSWCRHSAFGPMRRPGYGSSCATCFSVGRARGTARRAFFHGRSAGQALSLTTHATHERKSFAFASRLRDASERTQRISFLVGVLQDASINGVICHVRHLFFSADQTHRRGGTQMSVDHQRETLGKTSRAKTPGSATGALDAPLSSGEKAKKISTALFQSAASARAWSASRGARSINASSGETSASERSAARA